MSMTLADKYFEKIWNTCIRLTLLFALLGIVLGATIRFVGYVPHAWGVEFTPEDMKKFTDAENKNIEKGLKYFSHEWDINAAKRNLIEQIENQTCVSSRWRHKEDFREYNRFRKPYDFQEERKGKISSTYYEPGLDDAINRTIDEYDHLDFEGGFLMKNSALKNLGITYFYGSSDGYSIVSAGWQKFHDCKYTAICLGIVGFLIPIAFVIGTLILYFLIMGPGVLICKLSARWMKWTFKEFSK